MYHVKIVIVIDWYCCFFFFLWFEFSIWVWNFVKIFIYGAWILRFFFHNREKREIKDRQTRTLKGNEKKFELSAIRLFFLGIAGNCTAIFIADTSSLSTDPTDSSRSGLVVALRARSRALADVFEKNEQKNKTTSVHRVHRTDMLAAWNNDCSRFLGRIKEKYIICLSNRSPTVPLRGLGGWGYVSRIYASPGCQHVFWRYCSRLLSRHERPLVAIYFHSL